MHGTKCPGMENLFFENFGEGYIKIMPGTDKIEKKITIVALSHKLKHFQLIRAIIADTIIRNKILKLVYEYSGNKRHAV